MWHKKQCNIDITSVAQETVNDIDIINVAQETVNDIDIINEAQYDIDIILIAHTTIMTQVYMYST